MKDKVQRAIDLLNDNEFKQGIELLKEVLTDDPKNRVAQYNLALAYNVHIPVKPATHSGMNFTTFKNLQSMKITNSEVAGFVQNYF